ncbi:hypothetical protein AGR4A_Lc40416 [Agrobacterium tumefaciens str. B6]|uniref:Uncharacterized protein n=1 Tax=Agrobacterium tumefaciens str. B6 TaxID=1183423 RepID=A0A822V9I2_AGRTU|nr:hypothetical protein AGR4A_Lc40416 [Agrobacterium tumefaciens str. B6]
MNPQESTIVSAHRIVPGDAAWNTLPSQLSRRHDAAEIILQAELMLKMSVSDARLLTSVPL